LSHQYNQLSRFNQLSRCNQFNQFNQKSLKNNPLLMKPRLKIIKERIVDKTRERPVTAKRLVQRLTRVLRLKSVAVLGFSFTKVSVYLARPVATGTELTVLRK